MNKESQIVEEILDISLKYGCGLMAKLKVTQALSTHRQQVLKEAEKCVPAEDNPEIPQPDLTGHRSGVKKGWNLCRQATLQALETLKV